MAGDGARRLVLGELRDAANVPLFEGERLVDERVDQTHRLVDGVLPGADRDDIRVIVLTRENGGRVVPDQRRAHALTLFAAICSPLPEPPKTTPRAWSPALWSSTTACAALMQNDG